MKNTPDTHTLPMVGSLKIHSIAFCLYCSMVVVRWFLPTPVCTLHCRVGFLVKRWWIGDEAHVHRASTESGEDIVLFCSTTSSGWFFLRFVSLRFVCSGFACLIRNHRNHGYRRSDRTCAGTHGITRRAKVWLVRPTHFLQLSVAFSATASLVITKARVHPGSEFAQPVSQFETETPYPSRLQTTLAFMPRTEKGSVSTRNGSLRRWPFPLREGNRVAPMLPGFWVVSFRGIRCRCLVASIGRRPRFPSHRSTVPCHGKTQRNDDEPVLLPTGFPPVGMHTGPTSTDLRKFPSSSRRSMPKTNRLCGAFFLRSARTKGLCPPKRSPTTSFDCCSSDRRGRSGIPGGGFSESSRDRRRGIRVRCCCCCCCCCVLLFYQDSCTEYGDLQGCFL
mmetsp:Transcript_19464/g.39944  ORF Transcript_19464/g.39944 Transcript_19464/m.39944 type:complete len:391 (-) Transcript_19464:73-1245(-)